MSCHPENGRNGSVANTIDNDTYWTSKNWYPFFWIIPPKENIWKKNKALQSKYPRCLPGVRLNVTGRWPPKHIAIVDVVLLVHGLQLHLGTHVPTCPTFACSMTKRGVLMKSFKKRKRSPSHDSSWLVNKDHLNWPWLQRINTMKRLERELSWSWGMKTMHDHALCSLFRPL